MVKLAVDGLKRVLSSGFTKSELAEDEKNEYIIDSDPYSAYFEYLSGKYENPVEDYILKVYMGDIYFDFEGFCRENGFTDYTRTTFGKRIKLRYNLDRSYYQEKSTGRRKYKLKK